MGEIRRPTEAENLYHWIDEAQEIIRKEKMNIAAWQAALESINRPKRDADKT